MISLQHSRAEEQHPHSHPSLATLLLLQHRLCLGFGAASARCWLRCSFSSGGTPKSFSAGQLSVLLPLCASAWDSPKQLLALGFIELHLFSWSHFSSLSRSPWMSLALQLCVTFVNVLSHCRCQRGRALRAPVPLQSPQGHPWSPASPRTWGHCPQPSGCIQPTSSSPTQQPCVPPSPGMRMSCGTVSGVLDL